MNETKQQSARFQFGLKWLFIITAAWAVLFSVVAVWIHREPMFAVFFGGLAAWIALAVASVRLKNGSLLAHGTVVIVAMMFFISCLIPMQPNRVRGRVCKNNLNQIGKALITYQAIHGSFPPAYIADKNGKPMHSWRVLILRQLARRDILDKYDFNEPWDGPNNSKLLQDKHLEIFKCPSDWDGTAATINHTSYVLVTGPGTMWPGEKALSFKDAADGPEQTIMLVEVVNSGIHWAEPRDLDISELADVINPKTGKGISSNHHGGANVVFVDGHSRFVSEYLTPEQLKAILTRAGGENIDLDDL